MAGSVTQESLYAATHDDASPFCTLEVDMKALIGFTRNTVVLCALLVKRACLRLCGRGA